MPDQVPYISTDRLDKLSEELVDRSHHKRAADGFERPIYVSPLTWDEVQMLVAEVIARRKTPHDKGPRPY